jgi:exodeoxyribonuclease-3
LSVFQIRAPERQTALARRRFQRALVQPESREAFAKILKQGWVDSIRMTHPDEPMYTFWDYMRNRWPRDKGLRLDHLPLSARFGSRKTRATMRPHGSS